jgi:hypothetical protein
VTLSFLWTFVREVTSGCPIDHDDAVGGNPAEEALPRNEQHSRAAEADELAPEVVILGKDLMVDRTQDPDEGDTASGGEPEEPDQTDPQHAR